MQIFTIQPQGPTAIHDQLQALADQLDDLGTKVQRETRIGYAVSREWPVDVRIASRQLQIAAGAMQRLGGDRERVVAAALTSDAQDLANFADELASAYDAREHFGPAHADWTNRFTQPANDATAAVAILERGPALP